MFAPEDLNIVKGSPGIRRRFIDMEIGQVSPVYLYQVSQYNKLAENKHQKERKFTKLIHFYKHHNNT